jgi:hypothetical protein
MEDKIYTKKEIQEIEDKLREKIANIPKEDNFREEVIKLMCEDYIECYKDDEIEPGVLLSRKELKETFYIWLGELF